MLSVPVTLCVKQPSLTPPISPAPHKLMQPLPHLPPPHSGLLSAPLTTPRRHPLLCRLENQPGYDVLGPPRP